MILKIIQAKGHRLKNILEKKRPYSLNQICMLRFFLFISYACAAIHIPGILDFFYDGRILIGLYVNLFAQ